MTPNLPIILERARSILRNAINRVIKETVLPAYLIEGILLDLLADVRAQKATEIAAECEEMLRQIPPPASSPKPTDENEV